MVIGCHGCNRPRRARSRAPVLELAGERSEEPRAARGGGGAACPPAQDTGGQRARHAGGASRRARARRCSTACDSTRRASRRWRARSRTSPRLPDPIGTVLAEWTRPNGMRIQRRRVPLGVIGIIYESRPNVTADAGALCLKSGNAVILRGGSESARSNAAIHACLGEGLQVAGLPSACIQLVPTTDRAAVGYMLAEMSRYIDVIVPARRQAAHRARAARSAGAGDRSSRGPVPRVRRARRGSRHGAGDRPQLRRCAAPASAARPRRCWSTGAAHATHLGPLVEALLEAGCEVRGDETDRAQCDERVKPATEQDWSTEYLDAIIAVRVVDGVDAAIEHIRRYGSQSHGLHRDRRIRRPPSAS